MIKEWSYNHAGGKRDEIKKMILEKNYKSIDLGGSAMYWSYPECLHVADSSIITKESVTFFEINFEDKSTWDELLNYVDKFGKFDFSICSHTLEDVFNPLVLIEFLEKISNSGFVAVPSKYDEFSFLFANKYRGNAHHKQFFDIIDNELFVFPKFSWIESDSRSDKVLEHYKGSEISFLWESKIPTKIFGEGIPCRSDGELMYNFYNQIIN